MGLVGVPQVDLPFQVGTSAPSDYVVRSLPLSFLNQFCVCEFPADNSNMVAILVTQRPRDTGRREFELLFSGESRFCSEQLEDVLVSIRGTVLLQCHYAGRDQGTVKFSRNRCKTIRIHFQPSNRMHSFIKHRFRWFCHGNDTRTCRSTSMGPSRKRSGPVFGHRVRETVPYPWYGTMKDENSRGFNCSDRQAESTSNRAFSFTFAGLSNLLQVGLVSSAARRCTRTQTRPTTTEVTAA